jgi:curli biogenesis system outer membrane secretion channel CsgG
MWRAMTCLLCLLVPGLAQAASRQVEATGSGLSRPAAINEALIEAVGQAGGVSIAALQEMRSAMASVTTDDHRATASVETGATDIARLTKGVVESYQVLDMTEVPAGHFTAHILASIPVYESTANTERRRIAVAAFNDPPGARGVGALLRDRISTALTQARRFAVLDRANADSYAAEMNVLNTSAPIAEQVRAGQVMVADDIVTGTIRQTAGTTSDRVIGLTGEHVTTSTAGSLQVDFQVIDFASRQVKLADTVRLAGGASAAMLDQAGARIADMITQAIYPMRLIKWDDPAALVINQSGGTLEPGLRLRAMQMGEMMVDPYTKEPLGQTERQVGLVEITQVASKLSYAKLVSGQLPAADAQIVLRPAPAAPVARPVAARPPAPPAAIKLPGDL